MDYKKATNDVLNKRIERLNSDLKVVLALEKSVNRIKLPEQKLRVDRTIVSMIKDISKEIKELTEFLDDFNQTKAETQTTDSEKES